MATANRTKSPADGWNAIILDTARVVTMGGREIQFFHNEKDANAFVFHVYGVAPSEARKLGIKVEGIAYRGPRPGDLVTYTGDSDYYKDAFKSSNNILETICGEPAVCCAASAFRDDRGVSCSGGPVPFVPADRLTFAGLREARYWRWNRGYAGAGEGGNYTMLVPVWAWDGTKPAAFTD